MDKKIDRIIERVVEGDVDAFEEVVARYQKQVWALVASMLWDRSQTADLVQQVFLKAYAGLDTYDRKAAFWPWLRSIARHLLTDALRSQSRERAWLDRYREYLLLRGAERTEQANQRQLNALEDCRSQLAPEAREALSLRYEKRMTFEEIGRRLNRSSAASQRLLSRLRLALKKCIEKRISQYEPA